MVEHVEQTVGWTTEEKYPITVLELHGVFKNLGFGSKHEKANNFSGVSGL